MHERMGLRKENPGIANLKGMGGEGMDSRSPLLDS